MRVSIIAAVAENRVIGLGTDLPWRLPADLRHFRRITMGKPIVMGRRTFDSIGRPLPGRRNIVVSRSPALRIEGCEVVASAPEALRVAAPAEEVFCIGGATLYRLFLPLAQRMYLTRVHARFDGDICFPDIAWDAWREVSRREMAADDENPYRLSFLVLERVGGQPRRDATPGPAPGER